MSTLRQKIAALVILTMPMLSFAEGWADKVTVGGDFRLREEYIDQELIDSENYRTRIRARLNIDGQVNESLKVVFQIATGAQEATSTNQTLGGDNKPTDATAVAGGYKNRNIDLSQAYIDWAVNSKANLLAGKVKNTLYTPGDSDLLWDTDLAFEGLTFNYKCNCDETRGHFVNLGVYTFAERNAEETTAGASHSDIYQYAAQAGMTVPVSDKKLTFGLGYHAVAPIENMAIAGVAAKGNTFNGGAFANSFEMAQAFVSIECNKGSIYADYVSNSGADEENQAYMVGFTYGKTKEKGDWSIGYNFRVIEKDSVIGALHDSDFANGETDSQGHKVQLKYQIASATQGHFTYLMSERNMNVGTANNYDRAQLDFVFKF
jgi:Putative porin